MIAWMAILLVAVNMAYRPETTEVDLIQVHHTVPWGEPQLIAWRDGVIVDYMHQNYETGDVGELHQNFYFEAGGINLHFHQVLHTYSDTDFMYRYERNYGDRYEGGIWHKK